MTGITSLNYKALLANATDEIFDTMLSMKIEVLETTPDIAKDASRIVGSVGFAGDVIGCMNIHITSKLARVIAGSMLGEKPDDLDSEVILDVVGELSNMVGGDIKSRLCDAGMPCSLSIPSTMIGSNFMIESHGWMIHERIGFQTNEHCAFVEVYVKPGNAI